MYRPYGFQLKTHHLLFLIHQGVAGCAQVEKEAIMGDRLVQCWGTLQGVQTVAGFRAPLRFICE